MGITGTLAGLKTQNGSGTLSYGTVYSSSLGRSVYTFTINPGFTPELVAWTDGAIVGYWAGDPAHIAGSFRADSSTGDSGIKFTSTQIILPGTVRNGGIWYSIVGY